MADNRMAVLPAPRLLMLSAATLLIASTAVLGDAPDLKPRVWTIGEQPVIEYHGTPVLIDKDRVILKYKDGKRHFECAPDRLSEEDQQIIEKIGPIRHIPEIGTDIKMELDRTYIEESDDLSGPTTQVPVVTSEYWQLVPKAPDVGQYNNPNKITAQDACDFTIWQDKEQRWNLVSCIRSVANNDKQLNRLFYHWRSKGTKLTEQFWEPQGIFMMPHPEIGGATGALQAPHVIQHDGKYYMFYNSGYMYCMVSEDGINWERQMDYRGEPGFFRIGRDVLLFHDEDATGKWYAYYTKNRMVQRRADNLLGPWSEQEYDIGNNGNPESPFILKRDGRYYLWEQMNVFISDNPEKFDGPQITFTLTPPYEEYAHHKKRNVYAPEIIIDEDGQYYIAGYANGIFMAKLGWVERTPEDIRQWWQDVGLPENMETYQRFYDLNKKRLKEHPDHGWYNFAFERAKQNLEIFPKLDYKYIYE